MLASLVKESDVCWWRNNTASVSRQHAKRDGKFGTALKVVKARESDHVHRHYCRIPNICIGISATLLG